MAVVQQKAQQAHRRRQKAKGIKRVEVNVHKNDVALMRRIADALAQPERGALARRWLLERFGDGKAAGFKALLAAVSLDDLDLRRNRDVGRELDL